MSLNENLPYESLAYLSRSEAKSLTDDAFLASHDSFWPIASIKADRSNNSPLIQLRI